MIEPRIRRARATPEERAARQAGSALPTRSRNTRDDEDLLEDVPSRLPTSARRYHLPIPTREYMIALTNGKTLYVTEQRLATMGRDYQAAAQEVAPGTIAQKQHRQPHPHMHTARPP